MKEIKLNRAIPKGGLKIKGFSNYYFLGDSVFSMDRMARVGGVKGSYKVDGKEIKISLDKATGYRKLHIQDDSGNNKNLLFHRLVYAVHNDLEYSFVGMCCHYDDDKTNNKIKNLYLGDAKSNSDDRRLAAALVRNYNDGTLMEFMEKNGYVGY